MSRKPKDWTEPGLTVLQQVMRFQRLSGHDLAKESGVPDSTVARVVAGGVPRLQHALRIARCLKVTVEELWGHLVV